MSRNTLIDVFRGIDLLEMQATEISESPIFEHASYHQMTMTYADTIFPCFSFISGMTAKPYRSVPFRKNLQLIGLGIGYNALPLIVDGLKLRYLGVLQRHGLSSIIFNIVPYNIRDSVLFPVIMSGIWYAISVFGCKDASDPFTIQQNTAQQRIDYPIFGDRTYHEAFDPEGLLGSLMTSVTIWSGYWFYQQNFSALKSFLIGGLSYSLGFLAKKLFPKQMPISKPLWTPSFVLSSNGVTIVKFSLLKLILPYLPSIVVENIAIFGRFSMEIYFIGELLLMALKYPFGKQSIWQYLRSKCNKYLTPALTETFLVTVFNVTLVGIAKLCNNYNFRLRLF